MKIVRSELGKYHAHITSQISIDCVTQFPRCYLALKIHARDLSFGVNARIRATGSVDRNWPIIQQRKDTHQFALDRALSLLYLPAMELCAVILDQQFEVHRTQL